MTKGDMAPENAQNEGITHGKKTGAFAFVTGWIEVPSCIIMPLYHSFITMS